MSICRFVDEMKKMFFDDWRNKEKREIFILLCKQKSFGNCFYVGGGAEDDYGRYTRLRRLSFATGEEGLFGFIK